MSYKQEAAKFARQLRKQGFDVEYQASSGHFRVTHPDYDGHVSFGSTPSDHRWRKTAAMQIRQVFGMRVGT